jgi:hypothetical protein
MVCKARDTANKAVDDARTKTMESMLIRERAHDATAALALLSAHADKMKIRAAQHAAEQSEFEFEATIRMDLKEWEAYLAIDVTITSLDETYY